MHGYGGNWSFCHAGFNSVMLTYQGSFIGCIFDGGSVTCLCNCGYDAIESGVYYNGGVSLVGQFSWGSLGKYYQIITLVVLCMRRVVANMIFLATNKTVVHCWTSYSLPGVIK